MRNLGQSRRNTGHIGISRIAICRIAILSCAVLPIGSLLGPEAVGQSPTVADSPASVPAGAVVSRSDQRHSTATQTSKSQPVSPKQAREADDAYLDGAKYVERGDLAGAIRYFERASRLNPDNAVYSLALIVTRENYITHLVQEAAKASAAGDSEHAHKLLDEARLLDPNNHEVAQHFQSVAPAATKPGMDKKSLGLFYASVDPSKFPVQDVSSTLQGPVELKPSGDIRDVHLRGDIETVARNLYSLYGIKANFDSSITAGPIIDLEMNHVGFAGAVRALDMAAGVFAVPLQEKSVLIAKDTVENREALTPQVEETIYLPGRTNDEMQELANVARNIFDVKEVTASATGGYMLIRGNDQVLREVNAVYDDMLGGNPEVLFDVSLYEIDKSLDNNLGAVLPASAGVFSIAAEAQSLVSANQSIINQAVAAGLLKLNGTPLQNLITEVGFLVASGTVSAAQYTNLLGIFGGGLTFAGLYLGSNSSFKMALNSTEVSILDSAKIMSLNRQPATFRVGSRYPVVTGTYSSGVSSSLASSLSGLNINGTSVSSLLSQYLGSNSVSIPQFQFEDLGITLKLTPQVLRDDAVSMALDMKVEALAGSSLDNIPILNNRALTSTITVPLGQTAMLATLVSSSEMKALTGLPGLSELPGFQGTDQDRTKSSTELLITVTPHIVRSGRVQVVSRRIDTIKTSGVAE